MRNARSCSKAAGLICLASTLSLAAAFSSADAQAPVPAAANDHVIRVWGYTGLSAQLLRWEAAFELSHPGVTFENQLHGPATVMAGLYDKVADVALMGREIWPVETMAYHWVYQQQPFGVMVATSGLNAPGQSFTPVVIVNKKNPLSAITLSQLDAIYGSEHRAAPANIRTWGDLGLTGEWASKPIHPYGYGPEDALGVYFRHDVLRSDFKPNADSHLLSDREPGKATAAHRITLAIASDPYAIGYTSESHAVAAKVLALGDPQAIRPTPDALADHRYGLTRGISLYLRRMPNQPLQPNVDAFVRFILSTDAQALVHPSEGFLPLTPKLLQQQLHKLDAPMPAAGAPAED